MTSTGYSRIGTFLLQALAGTAGVCFLAAILGFCLAKLLHGSFTAPLDNSVSLSGMVLVGTVIGYLINRKFQIRSGKWVWVLPLAWMVFLMSDFIRYRGPGGVGREIWLNFFSNQCTDSACLYELAGTFPFIGSLGYSVGTWLAVRR
jgi:hypothetical protein